MKIITVLNSVKKLFSKALEASIFIFKLLLLFLFLVGPIGQLIINSINSGKIFIFDIAIFTPLAVTLSFSGLMYNRARSIESKRDRFKSVYVAERLLSASGYYLITLLATFLCHQVAVNYHFSISISGPVSNNPLSLIIFLPLWSFAEFCIDIFFSISSLSLGISGRRPRDVAYSVKKLLSQRN